MNLIPYIECYCQALKALEDKNKNAENKDDPANLSKPCLESDLLFKILVERDRIQSILDTLNINPDVEFSASNLDLLYQQDEILKKYQIQISQCSSYPVWKETLSYSNRAWWWKLEADRNKWFSRTNGASKVLSLVFLTISLGLMGDITPRFLLGNPDAFSATAASIQSVLTLLTAGITLTAQGKTELKNWLKAIKLPEKYWHELGAITSCLLMLGFFGIQKSLPALSEHYVEIAQASRKKGDWGTAEEHLKRSLYLNTDNADAQFSLGNLYEDLQQLDQARVQYQLSFQGGNLVAGNNLARLYIRKKEPSSAMSLLLKVKSSDSLDPKLEQAVRKNIGWAKLMQKSYPKAKAALQDAIEMEPKLNLQPYEIAPSHCLMAQVLDSIGDKKEALKEWSICNESASPTIPEQDEWLVLAQKRIPTK